MALTSIQLTTALGLVDRRAWRPMSHPVMAYVRASTFDDSHIGPEGAVDVPVSAIAQRWGLRAMSVHAELLRLEQLRVLQRVWTGGRKGGRSADVWSFNHDLKAWDVRWTIGRQPAFSMIANLRCDTLMSDTQPRFVSRSIGDTKRGSEATIYVPVAVHRGEFLSRLWTDTQTDRSDTPIGDTQIVPIRPGSQLPGSSSKNSSSAEQQEVVYDERLTSLIGAIRDTSGFVIFDGARHKPVTRIRRAIGDLEDVSWLVEAVRASNLDKWMAAVGLIEQLAAEGPPPAPDRTAELVTLRRQIAQLEADIAERKDAGYPIDDELAALGELQRQLDTSTATA